MICPCKSGKDYKECCKAFHTGEAPKTPLELMRSRYSAYVLTLIDYLIDTDKNTTLDDKNDIENFSKGVEWLGLKILSYKDNMVEFKAYYKLENKISVLYEKSSFIFEDGRWLYNGGEILKAKPDRNETCPCGSGKKFKKCCWN